jgi:hypothetical protein
MTAKTLARLMTAALRQMHKSRGKLKQGKQSMRQLSKGGSLSNIEIMDDNIKAFDPVARKYNVSYSLQKDASSDPPRWLVFFRAKDVDAITAAFKEFSNRALKRETGRTSVRSLMRELGEKVKNAVRSKTRHKTREGPER